MKNLRLSGASRLIDLSPLAQVNDLSVLGLDGATKLASLSPLGGLDELAMIYGRIGVNDRKGAVLAQLESLRFAGISFNLFDDVNELPRTQLKSDDPALVSSRFDIERGEWVA